MKIAYIYSTFAATGGTERMITEKVNYLSERLGYNVTVITCFQHENEANYFPISPKAKQINLCIPWYSQYKYKYPKRLWVKWRINKLMQTSLNQVINQVNPDILIGVSRFKANSVSKIKCNAKKIIECHEVKYNTVLYIKKNHSFSIRVFLKLYKYKVSQDCKRSTTQADLGFVSLSGGSQEAKSTRQLGVASLSGMAECSISHLNFTPLIHNTPQL